MGYSWYRVDSAFARHPKTLALKAELKEPLADAYVNRLWSWTQLYAPSGRFSSAVISGLESELLWTGSQGSLAAALEKTGWIDRVGDEFEVHDWPDFQGYHVKKSKKDADKKRKRRERASARTDSGRRADGAALSPRTAPPTDGRNGRTDGRDETNGTTPVPPRKNRAAAHHDPRHAPLIADLVYAFTERIGSAYPFKPRDAKSVAELLTVEPAPERILAAWRAALESTAYPKVRTLPELVTHFAHFVGGPTGIRRHEPPEGRPEGRVRL